MKKYLIILSLLITLTNCIFRDLLGVKENVDYIKVKDFADIQLLFPKNVSEINDCLKNAIELTDRELKKIINEKNRTFENTARALDKATAFFSDKIHPLSILEMVSPSKEIRDACRDAVVKAEEFSVDAFNSIELYNAFKEYVDFQNENLDFEQKYFLSEGMKDFIRSGLSLPKEQYEQVQKLQKEISKLSIEFDSNINQDKSFIKVNRDELEGLVEDFIAQLKKDGDQYILTCDYPVYFEVMSHCKIASTRQKLYLAFNNRAYPNNTLVLEKVIALRDRLAKKLGFKSFADYDIDSQMAKTFVRAESFILDLVNKSQDKAKQEFRELIFDLPTGVVLTKDEKIQPWDISYLKESYKKKYFDLDSRKIAEYFPMERTINELFNIYQKFFNLSFKISIPSWSWNNDVQLIEVYDNRNNKMIGYIFLDLYPRPDKYSHACHVGFIEGINDRPSAAVLVANFPKATKEKPSLLKHGDVLTFFHEFGHAMHHVLGRTELAAFAGTATKTDFVEMPSQMLEEWMWDKEILKTVSSHYLTREALPDVLIDKMIELKKFDSGYHVLRQCSLALISLYLFKEGEAKDSSSLVEEINTKYLTKIRYEPASHFQASFGHLMGYGARYYGYMWSEVFALDLFGAINLMGLLNPIAGRKLADEVLGKGGSVDPNILLRNFLGRDPNQVAFLKNYGFID